MKSLKKLLSIILMIVTITAIVAVPALAYKGEDFKAKVIENNSTVWAKASTNSSRIGYLKKGTTVTVTDYKGKWAKVVRNGCVGYMKIRDLIAEAPTSIVVTKNAAPIQYIKGGKGYTIAKAGTTLYVYGKDESGHYLVGNHKMTKLGYISRKDVINL